MTAMFALFVVVATSFLLASVLREIVTALTARRAPPSKPSPLTPEAIQHLAQSAKEWP